MQSLARAAQLDRGLHPVATTAAIGAHAGLGGNTLMLTVAGSDCPPALEAPYVKLSGPTYPRLGV